MLMSKQWGLISRFAVNLKLFQTFHIGTRRENVRVSSGNWLWDNLIPSDITLNVPHHER